jgi:hypothetical protein
MAYRSQFLEEHNAHRPTTEVLPAGNAAYLPPAVVKSTAKCQSCLLEECDPLKDRYTDSVTLATLRRDEHHMRDVFNRHKDLDNGLSKIAFIAALREVAAPVLLSHDPDGVYKLADTNMSDSVDFSEFGRPSYKPFSQTHLPTFFRPAPPQFLDRINALISGSCTRPTFPTSLRSCCSATT